MKRISVTKNNIRIGRRANPNSCPIALGVRATIKKGKWKTVQAGMFFIYVGHIRYKLPGKASQFIKDFDAGKKVQPFKFWLGKRRA